MTRAIYFTLILLKKLQDALTSTLKISSIVKATIMVHTLEWSKKGKP